MLTSPSPRNPKSTPIIFQKVVDLEDLNREWQSSKEHLTRVSLSGSPRPTIVGSYLVDGKSSGSVKHQLQICQRIVKLCKQVEKLEHGQAEGERLWDITNKVVVEKSFSELSRRARNNSGFIGRVFASAPHRQSTLRTKSGKK